MVSEGGRNDELIISGNAETRARPAVRWIKYIERNAIAGKYNTS
jgi:hypothetical protein